MADTTMNAGNVTQMGGASQQMAVVRPLLADLFNPSAGLVTHTGGTYQLKNFVTLWGINPATTFNSIDEIVTAALQYIQQNNILSKAA